MRDLDDLTVRLERMAKDLNGPVLQDVMTDIGVAAKGDLTNAVKADLGDGKFSGWPKGGALTSGFEHVGTGAIEVTPRPKNKWTVAEKGRKAGNLPKRKRGSKTVKTPWGVKTFTSANPMRTGTTSGKRTWSDGIDEIRRRTPQRALDAIMKRIEKVWNG